MLLRLIILSTIAVYLFPFSSPDPIVTTERPSSVVCRPSSVRPSSVRPSVRLLTFHILINSSEATGPI